MSPSLPFLGINQLCSSDTLETATYTQLSASLGANCNMIEIYNPGTQPLTLAIGASGSESALPMFVLPGANKYPVIISKGTRVAIKATTADITSGYLIVNFYH